MTNNVSYKILPRNTKSLQSYFREINKIKLLPPEQEAELTKRAREGDLEALEKLTKANLRFVITVAKQYQRESSGLTIEDLINEGNLGLIKATQRFDETKGFKFISYAVWWIRQNIVKAINEQSRMVRLPVNKIAGLSKMSKTFHKLEQEYDREPSNEELAEILHMDMKEVGDLRQLEPVHISLDAPSKDDGEGENETTLLDFLKQNGFKVDMRLQDQSLQEDLSRVMSSLDERQKTVTLLYFGIGIPRPLNLEEIGDEIGLTRERVRQLKETALRRLRKNSRATLLKKYL